MNVRPRQPRLIGLGRDGLGGAKPLRCRRCADSVRVMGRARDIHCALLSARFWYRRYMSAA